MNSDKEIYITGMTFTNVEIDKDEYSTYHVDREDILFMYPDIDISTENKFYFAAIEYMNNYCKIHSSDEAKIDVYYTKEV
jgi:hypothetical protein